MSLRAANWIGEIKFHYEGEFRHFVGHVSWMFFNDFKGVEIRHSKDGWTSVKTFEFRKMYLIKLIG